VGSLEKIFAPARIALFRGLVCRCSNTFLLWLEELRFGCFLPLMKKARIGVNASWGGVRIRKYSISTEETE
jgi:hypothetical protein